MKEGIWMKVLVVGGAGYIGSHTVYELVRQGHEVVIFDNLSTGNKEALHPEATLFEGNLINKEEVNAVFEAHPDIDLVMHFAAKIVVPESVEQPIAYYENNVYGVAVLLEQMLKHDVKNFMFSSTAAVYGEPTVTTPLLENQIVQPINPYGATKKSAEDLIQSVGVSDGLNYIIFRYFNVAGADDSGEIGLSPKTPLTHIIPIVNQTLLGMRPQMAIFGDDYPTKDGTCVRDYIHVADLAKAHVMGAEYVFAGNDSEIINLGSETGFSVKEIVEAAEEEIGEKVNHVYEERRAGDPAMLVASNKKAKELLNWEPQKSVQEMIASDYKWRKNPKY